MALNVKTIEMVAKIQSRRKPRVLLSCDALFTNYIPTIDDCLRDCYAYVKRAQEELDEESRNYQN